ncbi:MAG: hypothetical protein U1F45_08935 [Burkholderiales bacterium]
MKTVLSRAGVNLLHVSGWILLLLAGLADFAKALDIRMVVSWRLARRFGCARDRTGVYGIQERRFRIAHHLGFVGRGRI